MSKKNEDNLEQFFKKVVNQFDTRFLERDWKAMEKMLDEHDSVRASATFRKLKHSLLVITGVAVVSLTTYFFVFEKEITGTNKNSAQETQAAAVTEVPLSTGNDENSASLLSSSVDTSGTQIATSDSHQTRSATESRTSSGWREPISKKLKNASPAQEELKDALNRPKKDISGDDLAQTESNSRPSSVRASTPTEEEIRSENSRNTKQVTPATQHDLQVEQHSYQGLKQNVAKPADDMAPATIENQTEMEVAFAEKNAGKVLKADTVAVNAVSNSNKNNHNATGAANIYRKPNLSAIDTLANREAEPKEERQVSALNESTQAETADKAVKYSRWSVLVSVAPDFSSTRLDQISLMGGAFGLRISYQLLPGLAMQTGAIRSWKRYKSQGSDYNPPEGYWQSRTNGVVPDEVKGKCEILEIPLWFQAKVWQTERSQLFVSAGSSSYIMLYESYNYTFKTDNPGAAKGWSSNKASQYPFAVGHISVGYERNISRRIGVSVEPFVKIPFGKVGWPNINLFTTGFYVNARYRLLKRI